jgi:hypothetical protein
MADAKLDSVAVLAAAVRGYLPGVECEVGLFDGWGVLPHREVLLRVPADVEFAGAVLPGLGVRPRSWSVVGGVQSIYLEEADAVRLAELLGG